MGEVQKLKGKEKFAYGIGAVGKDMVYMLSASYVLYYYQDIMGVSAVAMGVILFIARIFDAFNDPIMGIIVAKTKTRWGKFRPWLFIGTLTNAIVLYLMFAAPPSLSGRGLVAYAAVTLHTLGRNLYDDGHSILVHDSCFYRKRKRARKSFCNGTFLCRRWFCHCHDHYCAFCIHAWQAGRRGRCIGN